MADEGRDPGFLSYWHYITDNAGRGEGVSDKKKPPYYMVGLNRHHLQYFISVRFPQSVVATLQQLPRAVSNGLITFALITSFLKKVFSSLRQEDSRTKRGNTPCCE